MIGTGLVGGKTTGMLLARAMVKKSASPVRDRIEVHDSFYVGADVFYTYMVVNGCWWIRQQQKDIDAFLSVAEYARRVILTGSFPPRIVANLSDMLDYFGQSPIIVRSSSLLEDNFGNAFSGKYESVFCPNQGSRERRLENLLTAIKTIYASTLSEKALRYRAQLGILDRDEQMPLLIQRVSGDLHGQYFFPAVGGVGYSRNPYVWHPSIDPKAGVIRIVYGMGTRAVDRSDDDYTRIAALNAVSRRPESGIDAVRKFSQKRVDVIDLEANQLAATDFHDLSGDSTPAELSLVATRDMDTKSWFITFDGLLEDTAFAADMSRILATLEEAYAHPVDIEFTVNFTGERDYRINIVQCRPFEARDPASGDLADVTTGDCVDAAPGTALVKLPGIPEKALISSESGTVIGRSRTIIADVLIYIPADAYDALPPPEKHRVARSIGAIMRQMNPDKKVILAGPGRWGTTSVSLGIPVTFAEISRTACVCEIVEMRDDLVPDVSLGTHFFNDLVEFDILYLALYPHKEGTVLDREYLRTAGNNVRAYLPDGDRMEDVIRVLEGGSEPLVLHADSLNQRYVIGR
jgi:pyruvate,water dikinase